ncbi:phage tail tip lysozyme [Enterococcus gilvus]|uniref:phage tail tip lysozyme n=1 Tax=Enterococcus gilvus TaxID=160453 RepID=UPI0028D134CB|nr:phage tail tip lysozyme [Enterococcus gilvus]
MSGTEFIYGYTSIPDDLSINGAALTDWDDLPEINRAINGAYTFYGNYRRKGQFRSDLKKGNFVKAVVEDGSWQFFEITKVKKNLSSVSVTGRHIGYMANRNFIDMSFTSAGNGQQIMSNLQNNLAFKQKFMYTSSIGTTHQFTAKQVKPIDALIGSNNGNQNLVGVTGGELDMDNFNLKLVKRIGADNGFRIDLGVNLEAIDSEVDDESVVNSLFLVGGVPDNDYDANKEPITFKYLEIAGVNDSNRRIAKRENSECKTINDLKKWGNTLFTNDRIQDPKATHEISMVALEHTIEYGDLYEGLATLHFGDTAHVKVIDRDEEIEERMIEYTWFPTLRKFKDIVLGNDLSLYTSRVETQAQEIKKKIDNRTETLVTNVLNATAWITGNSGGHVVFRPEKAPEEILIMDTAKVSTAKKVWRWNLRGLAYSSNGVNGPFDVAITSKGEIVANFIKVGVIQADVFENSFNGVGDVMKMVKGTLQVWNNKKKFMELTRRGMEFWGSDRQIGTIGTTDSAGNPFPEASTPTPIPDNALVIRTEGDGKYILISPNKGKGFVMLSNGTTIHFGDLNLQGKLRAFGDVLVQGKTEISKDLKVGGTLDAKKITINGQEVFPGQGGGGGNNGGGSWNGMYPPEVTSQADKFAWELWTMLLSKGYSKAAAAGILGNVQGEAGISMNPDIAQIGGPAYGIVQWDGSAYPLVPPATYDGRTYVQNLMRSAGITEDYKTMSAQGNLLDWTMYNGQWLGIVQPGTQSGFKSMTDPGAAAYTFERNYERPANAHPERQVWAVNWYNKFKDLKIPSAGDIVKVARSFINWFTYSMPLRWNFGSVENPDINGTTDCSTFVWLVLTKAGYKTAPRGTTWYTGSMTADARGARQYLTEVSPNEAKAGDIIIVNLGGGAGANGHTAVLAEDWHGYTTAIIENGGSQALHAGVGRVDRSFGYLLNGGDVCLARAKK